MTSQPPSVIRAAQAAYMAQDCIARAHDLTSLETAGQALIHYSLVLAQTSPEDQQLTVRAYEDIPSMGVLSHAYTEAGKGLCRANSALALAQVS